MWKRIIDGSFWFWKGTFGKISIRFESKKSSKGWNLWEIIWNMAISYAQRSLRVSILLDKLRLSEGEDFWKDVNNRDIFQQNRSIEIFQTSVV